MLPGPASQGVSSGRDWEVVVEEHVLSLDRRWVVEPAAAGGRDQQLMRELSDLHHLVAHAVGSRHWTTMRLVEMHRGRKS